MKYKGNIIEEADQLEKLLSERIVDLYNIKGMASERHALILYRSKVENIKKLVESSYKTKV